MTEQLNQQPEQKTPRLKKTWRILRWLMLSIVVLILLLAVAIFALASSDKGSRWLLEFVMNRQQMISYQYHSGNLVRGIIVRDILVKVKDVEVKVAQADIQLGWRAVVNKEIHLMNADVDVVEVINHKPPSNEEFKFNELKLPFVLRLDDAKLNKLVIKTGTTAINFYDVQLYDAVWSGTKIQMVNSSMAMDYLNVKKVNGYIQLDGKYPLNVRADLTIPSLQGLNLHDIKVDVRGDLDTVRAGVASATPDIISGYVIAHPVRKDVPMQGKLTWQSFHWPLLTDQALYSEAGQILLKGDLKQLNFNVDTDLSGKNIPQGNYQALLNTDLKQLNIEDFKGYVMQGELDLAGQLNWQKGVHWDINGRMQGLKPDEKVLPQVIQQFLPPDLTGAIGSQGSLNQDTDILAQIDFDGYEAWDVKLHQAKAINEKKQPWTMNVAWQDMNRELPYIGWLQSAQGDVDIVLADQGQDIKIATTITAHEKSLLPWGDYTALLNFSKNTLNVKDFKLTQGKGQLAGQATLNLPTDKTELKWKANLTANDFNPQTLAASAPVNRLEGTIAANGYAQGNQQLIHLTGIDLKGNILQGATSQQVALTGRSTVAVILHDGKQQSGLKGFAVRYDGHLNAQNYTQGPLKINVSGTPTELNIAELYHQGAAGQIQATGRVNFAKGLFWDLKAQLDQFKPHYFVSSLQGNLTGQVNTSGQWNDKHKFVSLKDLNLRGELNHKPVLGKGNLVASFSMAQGLMPSQFEANNLVLSYAKNIVYATGDAQRLQLNINAPNLNEIYAGLRGTVKGFLSVQAQPSLSVKSNLLADNLGFKNLVDIEKISLIGVLPTSVSQASKLTFNVQNAQSGEHRIDNVVLDLEGTLRAHLLKLAVNNQLTQFSVQLAGGLNAQNDWLGQIQKGLLNSQKIKLEQNQHANVVFRHSTRLLTVSPHCWLSKEQVRSEICFDQPLMVSPDKGAVSLKISDIRLGDFKAFLPEDINLTGQLNGFAHLSWLDQQPMKFDMQMISQNGQVGLSGEAQAVALDYREVRVTAKTLAEGLAIKLNADTPLLGSGFANVIVGTTGEDKSLSGLVAIDGMKLNLLKPFISDLRILEGRLSAAGKLNGTLKNPLFNGEVRLKDGKLAMASIPVDLQNIQLGSQISGSNAAITGRFNAGTGIGKITGNINWQNALKINLDLAGKDLVVAQPPLVRAEVSPFINLNVNTGLKSLTATGSVSVPKALITMPESSASVVNISSDVRVVDAKNQAALLEAAKPWHIQAKIAVELGKNVIFRGFGNDIPLAGKLNLSQNGSEIALRANGAIGVSRAVPIEAFGQRLDLKRAIARFGGELANPSLDIDANKNVQNHVVGVQVTGVANRPNIQIYNDAGLSEQEALNALLTGRISSGASGLNNTEGFKSDVNNTIAAAGISMGLGGTRALTNQIGRTFGLSGLALDAQGSGDDTQVSVTGYITPDLYLRYGVGIFTPVNKLTLRYQMNRRLYIEATSSVERAVDIFYHWKF